MPTLYIIRGISGSGKSTRALQLQRSIGDCYHFEADMYFYSGPQNIGTYLFRPELLPQAHAWCRDSVEKVMRYNGIDDIIVSNTFTRKWEYAPYIAMAERYGYRTVIEICTGRYTNVHGVPDDVVAAQLARFEY